jgi:hypothetical protein
MLFKLGEGKNFGVIPRHRNKYAYKITELGSLNAERVCVCFFSEFEMYDVGYHEVKSGAVDCVSAFAEIQVNFHQTRRIIFGTNMNQMTASVVLWSVFLATQRRCIVFPVRYELDLYMLCRRK